MSGVSCLRVAASTIRRRAEAAIKRRGYGSASALQYDYDDTSDDEEYRSHCHQEEGERRLINRREEPVVSSERSFCGRGIHWVIMGEPRTIKHVYAQRLSEMLEVPHIDMGSLLRQELHPRSSLYQTIAAAVNHRKHVPEDVIFGLLAKRLVEGYNGGERGFILEGIPRTMLQAEILDRTADIDLVINFKCPEGHKMKGKSESGNTPSSAFYRSSQCPASVHSGKTDPLEDYYMRQRKLVNYQVSGEAEEKWQGLLAVLDLQYLNIVRSPSTLMVSSQEHKIHTSLPQCAEPVSELGL